jgi:uncharacterized membrane protein
MSILIAGLFLFWGTHALRIVAPAWRERMTARLGLVVWRVLVSIVSVVSVALIGWGFAQARLVSHFLWAPPFWARHVAALLMLVAFVLLASYAVPRNAIKVRLRYPVTLAVAVWAFAHLLANGKTVDVVLFGTFLAWAIWDLAALRRQEHARFNARSPGSALGAWLAVIAGIIGWALFAFWLHLRLFSVAPFGSLTF